MLRRTLRRLLSWIRSEGVPVGHQQSDNETTRTDGGVATEGETVSGRHGRLLDGDFVRSIPFWLPGALLVGLFVYGAIGWNLVISLTDWSGLLPPTYSTFDLEMYELLWQSSTFWNATKNTIVLLVAFTVFALLIGLFLAILVDQEIRFSNTFRTIYLLPMSLSFVVTAVFWAWLYDAENGLINVALQGLGLDFLAYEWLGDPRVKLAAVIFAMTWQFSGYCMVVYLAGLRAIPNDQFEAAVVDGASTVTIYWKVILPQLRTSTLSAAVVLMVFALKAFDFLFVLFGTRPGPSVDILALMMYREAFAKSEWAFGSAVATVLFLLTLSIIGPYLYRQYTRGEL